LVYWCDVEWAILSLAAPGHSAGVLVLKHAGSDALACRSDQVIAIADA